MRVDAFDFHLPETHIATRPASPRDSARMLVVGQDGTEDRIVHELPEYLRAGDILVFNDTRVFPARLYGKRGLASIEVLLHKTVISPPLEGGAREGVLSSTIIDPLVRRLTPHPNPLPQGEREVAECWSAFARPAKKLRAGDVITFTGTLQATVTGRIESGEVLLQFNMPHAALMQELAQAGNIPLPPYIERKRKADIQDRSDYQTIYATGQEASVAAPTAGLHFTDTLFDALDAKGVQRAFVTLHVGAGTFQPVNVEDTDTHRMHSEYAEVSAETAQRINAARAAGGRVIAVGTTSIRTLESAANENGNITPFAGDTAIFITPGYRFKAVDMVLTNFHLPKSTLFMLVSAFSGLERMQSAYAHAIAHHYRFYSYGDACLLTHKELS